VELYLHSSVCFHGIVLNTLSTETTLSFIGLFAEQTVVGLANGGCG
jgi:hypothetical protein